MPKGNSGAKPPKRKRRGGFGRNPRGGNKKRSSYDMNEARASLGLPSNATFTQVYSQSVQTGPNPTLPRSPPKKVVKARLKEAQEKNEELSHSLNQAQSNVELKTRQVANLKQQLRDMSRILQAEKKASRDTISKLLGDAEGICELLVCGTAPTAIGKSISIMYETLYSEKPEDEPSVNFIRQCRVVVEIMGETVTALKLGSADSWKQLWTDATTRRQIPFTALIIGLLGEEEDIDPVVVSSCIFMDDERSETQADVKAKYPDKVHLIPSPDSINIDKLGRDDGVIMTDTCNGAQKVRRILVDRIDGAQDLDCMNHLRNVWIGGMEKTLSKYLNEMLRSSLDEIDSTLRVTTSISAVIRAIDKEFSLSANYPKGHGELFLEWIREHYPGVLLLHVERAAGSRQDLCTEGCLAIYMNYEYYVMFLDEMLRKRDADDKASILQQNLFVVLTSLEMLALSRLLSIIHLSISMPFRYLAGKSHQFRKHGWGAADMSRVIDTLYSKLEDIKESPSLILDETFMMNIFEEYRNELPPFKEYWELMYHRKQMRVVCRTDGTSVVHYNRIRHRLFHPTKASDVETTPRVIELAEVATEAIV
eukprot:scaffold95984_cov36-Cyclotella_meneghiniana.AAC.1